MASHIKRQAVILISEKIMPLTKLYKKVQDSVVQVIAFNNTTPLGFGSGSVIDDGSKVLTCAHCIDPSAQIGIVDSSNSSQAITGSVLFSDSSLDIAIIEFKQKVGTPVNFQDSNNCEIGNGAAIIGYPMGIMEQTLFSTHIASITSSHLRVDASVNHGNSGGPLFNLDGEQIGVVNAKHGSLSTFLTQVQNAKPGAMMSIGGIDPVKTIQILIQEMQKNLNLGIGYAIPTSVIKPSHSVLTNLIP